MLDKLFTRFSRASRAAYLKIVFVILTIAVIGFSIVGNYGFSLDEATEIAMVRRNFELITQGKPIPGDLKYFGTVFNFTAEAAFQIQEFIRSGFSHNPLTYEKQLSNEADKLDALRERVKVKHVLTFFVSLLTYVAVAGIVGIFCGWDYAWFGALALAFVPIFWGHSFFNPKDVPFAALFTFCTFVGAYIVNYYVEQVDREVGFTLNRRTLIYSILFGILTGLLTGIRIGGLFFPFFTVLTYLIVTTNKAKIVSKLYNLLLPFTLIFLAWLTTTIAVQPASWSNPLGWFIETVGYLSKHPLPITTLFEGKEIPIRDIPWYYLPKWVLITTPLIFLVAFVVGIIFIILRYSSLSILQRACFVLILLQIFFLPLVAIVKGSADYDGLRHFLFVMPGITAISAVALVYIYQKITKRNLRLIALAFIITVFSAIGLDMASLHPYEYIYFNRVSGGLAYARDRYDTDYWGLTMRDAIEWINKNAEPPDAKVLVNSSTFSAALFAAPSITVVDYGNYLSSKQELARPFYYLAWPRWGAQSKFPECPVVYRVMRQGVPLTIAKRCG